MLYSRYACAEFVTVGCVFLSSLSMNIMCRNTCTELCVCVVLRLLCAVLAHADAVDWIVVNSHLGRKLLVIGMQVQDVVKTCYTDRISSGDK